MIDPVCIVVFREPIENAVSLTDNAKKSAGNDMHEPMTPERWLRSWEEGALHYLSSPFCSCCNVQLID